jgi:hypothetical protein
MKREYGFNCGPWYRAILNFFESFYDLAYRIGSTSWHKFIEYCFPNILRKIWPSVDVNNYSEKKVSENDQKFYEQLIKLKLVNENPINTEIELNK